MSALDSPPWGLKAFFPGLKRLHPDWSPEVRQQPLHAALSVPCTPPDRTQKMSSWLMGLESEWLGRHSPMEGKLSSVQRDMGNTQEL